MELGGSTWMLIWGAGLIAVAALILWRTSRYDLKGAALESAWDMARGNRTAENPTALERKYQEIAKEATAVGKARRAAGTVAGHFVAQALNLVALIKLLAGAGLIAAGLYW